jgi:hypothetical protein
MNAKVHDVPVEAPEFRDFVVAGGCAVCEGEMTVRITPGTMRGWCAKCGWISKPVLLQGERGMAVAYPPRAAA